MLNYYVYEYTRLDTNEVFYVGKGTGNRCNNIKDRNSKFKNLINSTYYKVEKILENLSEADAFEAEISFIKYRKSLGQASCNLTDGGEGHSGFKPSVETLEKRRQTMLKKNLKGVKRTPEQKERMSEACKKRVNPNVNFMIKTNIGKECKESTRVKIGLGNKGKIRTQEHKDKISATLKLRNLKTNGEL